MPKILQKDNEILRAKAMDIPVEQITGKKIQKMLQTMIKVLDNYPDGAALAAPQIGVSARVFVVSKKIFINPEGKPVPGARDLVFINPRLAKIGKRRKKMDEGCLSVRGIFGEMERADKATIEAYNEFGQKISYTGSGLLSQIFQHELDHLEGVLFTDKAKNLVKAD